jgi:hypothetical protein
VIPSIYSIHSTECRSLYAVERSTLTRIFPSFVACNTIARWKLVLRYQLFLDFSGNARFVTLHPS